MKRSGCFPSLSPGRFFQNPKKFTLYPGIYTFIGILLLVSEIWKQWTLTFRIGGGAYSWWHFPFQLCSIPMYLCLTVGVLSASSVRKNGPLSSCADRICPLLTAFLMDFGLLGGIFAFFDTSGMHYGYLPLTIHSFAWHILLILDPRTDHSRKGFFFSAGLYLACCGTATIFNLWFRRYGTINLFYISPYCDMNQKVFCRIADLWGNGPGITAYIFASLAGAGLLHLTWKRTADILSRRQSFQPQSINQNNFKE